MTTPPPVYEDGPFSVTPAAIRIFSKAYPLTRVERIQLRRDPLFLVGPFALLLFGFGWAFWEYLYAGEKLFIFGASIAALYGSSRLGTLYIQVGSHNSPAAIWSFARLKKLYDAATNVLPHH